MVCFSELCIMALYIQPIRIPTVLPRMLVPKVVPVIASLKPKILLHWTKTGLKNMKFHDINAMEVIGRGAYANRKVF